jgi:hypothetical protein
MKIEKIEKKLKFSKFSKKGVHTYNKMSNKSPTTTTTTKSKNGKSSNIKNKKKTSSSTTKEKSTTKITNQPSTSQSQQQQQPTKRRRRYLHSSTATTNQTTTMKNSKLLVPGVLSSHGPGDKVLISNLEIPSLDVLQVILKDITPTTTTSTTSTTTDHQTKDHQTKDHQTKDHANGNNTGTADIHIPSTRLSQLKLQNKRLPLYNDYTPYAGIDCCLPCRIVTVEFMRLGLRWRIIAPFDPDESTNKLTIANNMDENHHQLINEFEFIFSSPAKVMKESIELCGFIPGSLSEIYGWFDQDLFNISGNICKSYNTNNNNSTLSNNNNNLVGEGW